MAPPAREDRIRGAIWGQFVGDAAALGSHWFYDLDELAQVFPGGPVGFEPPPPGHYHARRQPGDQTHYGDGALVLLDTVSRHGGFDPRVFGAAFIRVFEDPQYPGYLDKATKGTIANFRAFTNEHPVEDFDFQRGADDDQPATLTRISILVGRYAEVPLDDLMRLVDALALVTQDNPTARADARFSALLLRFLIDGRSIEDGLDAAVDHLANVDPAAGKLVHEQVDSARQAVGIDTTKATLSFGQSCPLPYTVPSALHVLLRFPDDFEQAVTATLRAGGDSAARASMVGSWLGAHLGVNAVPAAWRSRLSNGGRISAETEKILAGSRSA
ncbi:MAG TPA: ADP-ribosylglycohydrolase family protein [Acidimicrobiales bacterium]|nr:ADP-ribosylglycohydrolase family protein [Acidimicrobiales bacterium]